MAFADVSRGLTRPCHYDGHAVLLLVETCVNADFKVTVFFSVIYMRYTLCHFQ